MITTLSLTNDTLTVILDNGAKIVPVRSDNPKWSEILELVKQFDFTPEGKIVGPEDKLLSLLSLKAVVETYSVGQLSINSTGVTYRGQPLHGIDSARVLAFLRDGLPFKPIANYMARKLANPSARAISEMYPFLEHKNMPLTPEGKIIAYKGVRSNFYSVMGNTSTVVISGTVDSEGHILNTVGSVIEVERSSVDDNFNNGCSFGLHAGSLQYAKGWGQRVILVEIDPADVVSIPLDCNCQKLRCCKYKVVGEYTGPMNEAFTDEFSDNPDDSNESGDDSNEPCNCGSEDCWECASPNAPVDQAEAAAATMDDAKAAVATKVREVLADILVKTPEELRDSRPMNELEADELDEVEFCLAVEDEFQISLDDERYENIFKSGTVSDLVEYIYTLVNPTPAETAPLTVTPVEPPPIDDQYVIGKQDGTADCLSGRSPKYLEGDQWAADSDLHADYINGYLSGYAQA